MSATQTGRRPRKWWINTTPFISLALRHQPRLSSQSRVDSLWGATPHFRLEEYHIPYNPSIQVIHASIHPCAHGPHQTRPQPFWDAHEAGVDGADLGWVSYVCEADGSNSCGIERLASGARLPARQGHSRLPRLRAARCHHRPPWLMKKCQHCNFF